MVRFLFIARLGANCLVGCYNSKSPAFVLKVMNVARPTMITKARRAHRNRQGDRVALELAVVEQGLDAMLNLFWKALF